MSYDLAYFKALKLVKKNRFILISGFETLVDSSSFDFLSKNQQF